MPSPVTQRLASAARWALAGIRVATGLFLAADGVYLIVLGGSWYFVPAWLSLVASGVLIGLRRQFGVAVFLAIFLATLVWALWEVGVTFWPLVSRLFAPAVLAVFVLVGAPGLRTGRKQTGRFETKPSGMQI